MKQVTIDTVRERIAELEIVNSHGELSLRGEFELACLRMLAASLEAKPVVYSLIFRNMEGKLYDYVNVNTTFATMEEAQSYGKGGRYVTHGDGSIKWVADPSLDPVVVPLYTAPPVQVNSVNDDVRNVVVLLENNEWAEHCTKTELGQRLESEITRLHNWLSAQKAAPEHKAAVATLELKGYTYHGGQMWKPPLGNPPAYITDEPATDNTAQQFEALATSAQREPVAAVKHYTGNEYPTLKFAQNEWCVCGDREDAQELADAINALATRAGSGKL
ncbi:conserved phage protein [Escherichia phage vB_EcoM_ECO1230-10]|uniref:Conserved phage protein n=1 Tax=Escherichia phage vB_EcoM_ECO1230-10 TaxID=669875 RepID=D5LH12_9CAUD|nr:conserved phage protein [Escherichia phage vB_EcoM_ECO1230-10]ADE87943.1 conserved phage protein [Escherichia phage vB_EcoM_ECO1230-10]